MVCPLHSSLIWLLHSYTFLINSLTATVFISEVLNSKVISQIQKSKYVVLFSVCECDEGVITLGINTLFEQCVCSPHQKKRNRMMRMETSMM